MCHRMYFLITFKLWLLHNCQPVCLRNQTLLQHTPKSFLIAFVYRSYFITSSFSLCALCFLPLFYQTLRRRIRYASYRVINDVASCASPSPAHEQCQQPSIRSSQSCCITSIPSHQLSISETFTLSVSFCIIWFSMTYFSQLSVSQTSVASNSIISSMSGPGCLILSRIFLTDYTLTTWNLMGVTITVIGSCLIGYLDSFKGGGNQDHLVGDILAVLSAMIYSIYVVGIAVKIGDENKINLFLWFGFFGIVGLFVLWPGLFVLDAAGLETFEMPSPRIWFLLSVQGILFLLSNYFWAQVCNETLSMFIEGSVWLIICCLVIRPYCCQIQ